MFPVLFNWIQEELLRFGHLTDAAGILGIQPSCKGQVVSEKLTRQDGNKR